jgi:hypothetical protein
VIISSPKMLKKCRGPGPCSWCGKPCRRREAAHVIACGHGGGRRLDVSCNLVSLGLGFWASRGECTCHQDHHSGDRPLRCDLLDLVAARENILQGDVEAVLYLILRLDGKASRDRIEAAAEELGNDAQRGLYLRTLKEAERI